MKALVVDPDRSARGVVKRMLSHVNVETVEADNGLIALSQLEQADPDFVVLEIDMPILSGPDCLAAIRQSPARPDIPVICITASGTRDNVHRMVALGVADFLLKPINPAEVLPRIKNLLVRVAQWRQRQSNRSINSLMIVDSDPNFLAFAKPLLDASFEVLEVGSSTSAAIAYRDASPRPTVVCLAEGLPLMSEDLLVDVIRRMAIEAGSSPPQFYLLTSSAEVPPEKQDKYAGVVKKAFVPQVFVDEFRRVVLRERSPFERLRHVVHDELRAELITATRQTIGVMMGSELTVMHEGEAQCPAGVYAEVGLVETSSDVVLRTLVGSGRAEVETMAGMIMRREITVEEGANEVLGELANTIAGRMRASLMPRGFDLKMGLPQVFTDSADEPAVGTLDLEAVFRTAGGQFFRVGLLVKASGSGFGVVGGSESPATATLAPADGGAQASVDDVLF